MANPNLFQTIRTPVWGTGSVTAYTGTAGTTASILRAGVNAVWVLCTTAAYVRVGADPTAAAGDWPVAANVPIIIPIENDGGFKVSAVQVASGGNLHVIGLV